LREVLAGRRGAQKMVPGESALMQDLLAAPGRRWQRVLQVVLVCAMVSATAGVLVIVVQSSVLLGRMTTDVSIAQERTTNLHNLQRETLRLLQELTEFESGGDFDAVTIRRGLVGRMMDVVQALFPVSAPQAHELRAIHFGLDSFAWSRLGEPATRQAARASAQTLVSGIEVRIKNLYDEQEKFFYAATLDSLAAKRKSQDALAVLVSLVVVMALCWLIVLRRRTRSRLARAYSALLTEVSERRTLQHQLTHQAFHDALTDLPNRALFIRRLQDSIQLTDPATTAVLLIDLDGFKSVNDTLGHGAGDELLQQVAERLRDCVRDGDTVARLGGDEFAVVMPAAGQRDATAVSRRLIETLEVPFSVAGQEISISASVGIAHLDDQSTADELLCDADIAMYEAKKAGKARYAVFERGLRDQALQRAHFAQRLARAVEFGEIDVFYQPIVDVGTNRILAMEALARWHHPDHGLISPGVFIPIAEESGLIGEIGRAVLRQACRTVQRWRTSVPGCENLSVTVNVSVRQLLSDAFSLQVFAALQDSGLPPPSLTLEITESMLLEDSGSVMEQLDRIKRLGVRLAMDDFGAGYSSITSLLRLKVDVLKIDRTFLDVDSRSQGTLIRAITDLGHTLRLSVVAEGVETAEQLAHVRTALCDAAQGYLLSAPMPEILAHEYLQRTRAHHSASADDPFQKLGAG
jgi:diguanylate cyclase (GGDEF)-like protein